MSLPRIDQESLHRACGRGGRSKAPKNLAAGSASFSRFAKPCLICLQIGLRFLFGAGETELLCSFFRLLFVRLAVGDLRPVIHRC